jgi:hypothetical protein
VVLAMRLPRSPRRVKMFLVRAPTLRAGIATKAAAMAVANAAIAVAVIVTIAIHVIVAVAVANRARTSRRRRVVATLISSARIDTSVTIASLANSRPVAVRELATKLSLVRNSNRVLNHSSRLSKLRQPCVQRARQQQLRRLQAMLSATNVVSVANAVVVAVAVVGVVVAAAAVMMAGQTKAAAKVTMAVRRVTTPMFHRMSHTVVAIRVRTPMRRADRSRNRMRNTGRNIVRSIANIPVRARHHLLPRRNLASQKLNKLLLNPAVATSSPCGLPRRPAAAAPGAAAAPAALRAVTNNHRSN